MTNPIHQWLEGKKKETILPDDVSQEYKDMSEKYDIWQETIIDKLIADSPSLLSAMEAEIKKRIGGEKCDLCFGTRKEICDNPDHGFLEGLSFRGANESACPCCGHNKDYTINNTICEKCKGTGLSEESSRIHTIIHEVLTT